jgi:hypothetical protein
MPLLLYLLRLHPFTATEEEIFLDHLQPESLLLHSDCIRNQSRDMDKIYRKIPLKYWQLFRRQHVVILHQIVHFMSNFGKEPDAKRRR